MPMNMSTQHMVNTCGTSVLSGGGLSMIPLSFLASRRLSIASTTWFGTSLAEGSFWPVMGETRPRFESHASKAACSYVNPSSATIGHSKTAPLSGQSSGSVSSFTVSVAGCVKDWFDGLLDMPFLPFLPLFEARPSIESSRSCALGSLLSSPPTERRYATTCFLSTRIASSSGVLPQRSIGLTSAFASSIRNFTTLVSPSPAETCRGRLES
mmetsp:Transcript_21080/g.45865  ORF Transcript_21080/g.45865 Transcript_21080/m.45865 type:complete len:211 (+) Transcript_21080:732-1364(+)